VGPGYRRPEREAATALVAGGALPTARHALVLIPGGELASIQFYGHPWVHGEYWPMITPCFQVRATDEGAVAWKLNCNPAEVSFTHSKQTSATEVGHSTPAAATDNGIPHCDGNFGRSRCGRRRPHHRPSPARRSGHRPAHHRRAGRMGAVQAAEEVAC
jgi:hypothetical protein